MRKPTGLIPLFLFVTLLVSAQQPPLQITAPASGTLVRGGQTVTIMVSADPSLQNVSIISEDPLPEAQPTSNPSQFTLVIPAIPNMIRLR